MSCEVDGGLPLHHFNDSNIRVYIPEAFYCR